MGKLKTVFDESQQTIVLLAACGVASYAALREEWGIAASLISTVLGYVFMRKALNQNNASLK